MLNTSIKKQEPTNGLMSLYETVTNFFTLYDRAREFEHRDEARQIWDQLADNLLEEVGEFFEIWQMNDQQKAQVEDMELVTRACFNLEKRIRRSMDLITPWVSHRKLPHIFDLFEQKILTLLHRIIEQTDILAPVFHARIEASRARRHLLKKLQVVYDREMRQVG